MKTWPNVDKKKLALIGLGITASGALNAQMRNPEVDALVSLDGGIPTLFEDRLLKRASYFDIAGFNVPLLVIYAPHPNVDPAILDQYKYSTRYYVNFPKMSEYHFLNYGMFDRFVPNIIGKAPGDTKSGFELAARYVLAFLGAHLKNDAQAAQFLQASSASELVKLNKKPGLTAPPRFFEIKRLIRTEGIQSFVALYRKLKESDPQPFSQTLLVDLFNWASYQRDPEWKERKEIALIRMESFPQSSRAHFTVGQVAMQINDRELARKHYKEALRLLPGDEDPVLDGAMRKRIEQVTTQNLETLGK
jgi:tetratricopeptide (TPR) repeat protein